MLPGEAMFSPYSHVSRIRTVHTPRWESAVASLYVISLYSFFLSSLVSITWIAFGPGKGPIPHLWGSGGQRTVTSRLTSWHFCYHHDYYVCGPPAHRWAHLSGSPFPLWEQALFLCCSSARPSSVQSPTKKSVHSTLLMVLVQILWIRRSSHRSPSHSLHSSKAHCACYFYNLACIPPFQVTSFLLSLLLGSLCGVCLVLTLAHCW